MEISLFLIQSHRKAFNSDWPFKIYQEPLQKQNRPKTSLELLKNRQAMAIQLEKWGMAGFSGRFGR